jgi:hypothetical protein
MNKLGSSLLTAAAVALLAGCAWKAPMSEVTGVLYSPVNKDLYPTGILAIDGVAPYTNPMPITPGKHVLRVQGLGPNWANAAKELSVDFEACKRYYIAGYRAAPNTTDWEPRVDVILPISGCPTNVAAN